VRELTGGHGVPVVFDGVGKATFERSIECLSEFGMLVSFGNASGAVPPVELFELTPKCLYLTRPTLRTHVARRADLVAAAEAVFGMVTRGALRIAAQHSLPLREAAAAHRLLEGRRTIGSLWLQP
jgi:NADPH2:quinone reductase